SRYFERGFVTYSNGAKVELLGVEARAIEAHGAVSEPVAAQMAAGARRKAGVEVGIGVTGIAGPEGGSQEKPVGTVFVAVSSPRLSAPGAGGGQSTSSGAREPPSAGAGRRPLSISRAATCAACHSSPSCRSAARAHLPRRVPARGGAGRGVRGGRDAQAARG